MLMVLLALIDLGRSRVHRATRWLWMALSGSLWLGGATACEETEPPADDAVALDARDVRDATPGDIPVADPTPGDLPAVDAHEVPDVPRDCGAMAFYGPQPCETDADCVQREGPGWYCDTANAFDDGCGGQVLWPLCRPGDVPMDAVTPDTPLDVPRDCPPVVAYGPPPCTNDQDCENWGEDYVCDKAHPVTDPCTGSQWYQCREKPPATDVVEPPADLPPVDAVTPDTPAELPPECQPVTFYGPSPCTKDADCEPWFGAGATCEKAQPADACGTCKAP